MEKILNGNCLCGAIEFSLKEDFNAFYQCHCKQCKQLTGTAFASNLFTGVENINWLKGFEKVAFYEHPDREFSKAFCENCGSAMPFINKSKTSLVVPAGSLNEMPSIEPQANIFVSEEACWLKNGLKAKRFNSFPE